MTIKPKWPRKQRLTDYAKNNFTDPDGERQRLRRQCFSGDLPAVKEGGTWFVWVLPDGAPAYGYSEELEQPKSVVIEKIRTGNAIADAVLMKKALEQGSDLR
jgi:hypothetical protein